MLSSGTRKIWNVVVWAQPFHSSQIRSLSFGLQWVLLTKEILCQCSALKRLKSVFRTSKLETLDLGENLREGSTFLNFVCRTCRHSWLFWGSLYLLNFKSWQVVFFIVNFQEFLVSTWRNFKLSSQFLNCCVWENSVILRTFHLVNIWSLFLGILILCSVYRKSPALHASYRLPFKFYCFFFF